MKREHPPVNKLDAIHSYPLTSGGHAVRTTMRIGINISTWHVGYNDLSAEYAVGLGI